MLQDQLCVYVCVLKTTLAKIYEHKDKDLFAVFALLIRVMNGHPRPTKECKLAQIVQRPLLLCTHRNDESTMRAICEMARAVQKTLVLSERA